MDDPFIISPQELSELRTSAQTAANDVARQISPESINATTAARLIRGFVQSCALVQLLADEIERAREAIKLDKQQTSAAPPQDELRLEPLDNNEIGAKDGRSILRRCTEALFTNRKPTA